jgi:ferric-dicitrate binding protein FerR (iron transport regulator)
LTNGKGHLHRGKLAAHVPPQAVGFEIETPTARIVDLGTDFRLAASGQETKLLVATGKTDLYALSASDKRQLANPSRQLESGQAVSVSSSAQGSVVVQDVEYDPNWLADLARKMSELEPAPCN